MKLYKNNEKNNNKNPHDVIHSNKESVKNKNYRYNNYEEN
jgi:hypothetical protein